MQSWLRMLLQCSAMTSGTALAEDRSERVTSETGVVSLKVSNDMIIRNDGVVSWKL
jgi:hypothetical protein